MWEILGIYEISADKRSEGIKEDKGKTLETDQWGAVPPECFAPHILPRLAAHTGQDPLFQTLSVLYSSAVAPNSYGILSFLCFVLDSGYQKTIENGKFTLKSLD